MNKAAERSVTEVRIIEAAVQLFSRHGYKGASTREIAHLAASTKPHCFAASPERPICSGQLRNRG